MARIKKIDRKNERNRTNRHDNRQYVSRKRGRRLLKKQDVADYKKPEVGSCITNSAKIAHVVGAETLKRTRMIAKQSEDAGDQEAAEQYQSFMTEQAMKTGARLEQLPVNRAKTARDRNVRIHKKMPDIRNVRDINANVRTIRKADNVARKAERITLEVTKNATEAGKQAVIATEKVVQAKKTEVATRKAAEWLKKIVKGIIEGLKQFVTVISSISVPILLVLVLAGLIAGIVASAFGIFFVGESESEDMPTLRDVVLSINQEYNDEICSIQEANPHDELVIVGGRSSWPDILAIYAVSVTTDPENPMDVVTMTDDRIEILRNLFWEMNTITYETEEVTEVISVQSVDEEGNPLTDDHGNPIMEDQESVTVILHITISHLSALEEASSLGFSDSQYAQLSELLDPAYATLWMSILRGVGLGSDELVTLALSQLGNEGGEKYWRWAGLSERCPWCALFVSWCADQTGLLATGKIPYFSFVTDGVAWFQANDKWIDGSLVDSTNYEQVVYPGMLIFFDWAPQDGVPDHVGIVTSASNGYIYTVEGNNGDAVVETNYAADSESVYGLGISD